MKERKNEADEKINELNLNTRKCVLRLTYLI